MEELKKLVMALIGQIEISGFTDEHDHELTMNKAYQDLTFHMLGINQESDLLSSKSFSRVDGQGSYGKMKRYFEAVKGKTMASYEQIKEDNRHNPLSHAGSETEPHTIEHFIDDDIVICPTYMTDKAVGADAFSSEEVTIQPWEVKAVPTGIKAKFPGNTDGLFAFVRSSVPGKKGLLLANGVGVIEEDYHGNPKNDGELGFLFLNFSDQPVTIKRFERVGQLALLPIERFENAGYAGKERGESGSTGK